MKLILPLRHRTGVVMVTECTAWYPNACWSSRLKERLLSFLESHAPQWTDTFVGFLFFFNSPRHKYLHVEKWIMGISVIIYTLRFQRKFLCECHRDSVTPQQTAGQSAREPSQRMMTEHDTHTTTHTHTCNIRNHAAAYGTELFTVRVHTGQKYQNSPLFCGRIWLQVI